MCLYPAKSLEGAVGDTSDGAKPWGRSLLGLVFGDRPGRVVEE
ncbi:hypothetical protein [Phormidium tenue]|nr:hypothetical protein [Phormidium tenue]